MKWLALLVVFVALSLSATASANTSGVTHRASCHRVHACPSDHATYRWGTNRLLCVKPTSEERTKAFKIRIRYGGLIYWCRR